jgi:acyl carrier protein
MTTSVLDRVRHLAADLFDLPLETITSETSPATVERWDSLQHLNLVLSLEETFGLQFPPEETEQMSSIEAIARLVERKLDARA